MIKMIPREEYLLGLPKKRMAAGAIIMNSDNEVLIVKTSYKDSWGIPGGVTDKGESLKQCAKREVMEELGIDIIVGSLLVLEYFQTDIDDCLLFIFDGGTIKKDTVLEIDNEEIVEALFVSEDQLDKYITSKGLLNRVERSIIAKKEGTYYFESF